jgi:8-oxo-dGTP pyrophosphatase MutT (NUDIX family)
MLFSSSPGPSAPPRDAATVVLLREDPHADALGSEHFSVFMVRRHAKSGFMAGAYVFPGGVLEPEDGAAELLTRLDGRTPADAAQLLGEEDSSRAMALHVAALRETFEEAGVLLGRGPNLGALAAVRGQLVAGEVGLALAIDRLGWRLAADALTPLSRWVTPEVEPRRYDARFFLALAPREQQAVHDAVEVTAGVWLRPSEALSRGARGELALAPPTLRTLENLACFERAQDAIEAARARRPPLVRPVFHATEGSWALVLPGDPAHPERERVIEGTTRFALVDGVFRSVEP